MARHISAIVILLIVGLVTLSFLGSFGGERLKTPQLWRDKAEGTKAESQASRMEGIDPSSSFLTGDVIAPKLENATAKAELGRAAWKLFHTMMARFPEKPSEDDSLALKTYIQLFARLYPCGDCARHFQLLLNRFPPQVGSRNSAAGWACFVHNQVNERLKKPAFDCANIGDFYDCGCGDDKEKKGGGGGGAGDKRTGGGTGAATELKKNA